MRNAIISELERIAGDRLTPALREEIAVSAIKIFDAHNKVVAATAIDSVKQLITQVENSPKDKEALP